MKHKKPSALNRAKLLLVQAQGQTFQAENRVKSLTGETERNAKTIADKNEAIAKRDEKIALLAQNVSDVKAERDRLIRMVDQFTSVQIIGHGQTLATVMNVSVPGGLRKT